MILDGAKIGLCVFVLAILEVAATPQLTPFGGGPDLIIILVVALALWRGMEAAAIAGFAGGLLLDAMTFEHLGMQSLVYVGCAWAIATYANRREAGPGMLEPPPPRALPWLVIGATAAQFGNLIMHVLLGDHPAGGHPLLAPDRTRPSFRPRFSASCSCRSCGASFVPHKT